jgi:Uncharacterized BCR, YaiI/YqxD family COG1671
LADAGIGIQELSDRGLEPRPLRRGGAREIKHPHNHAAIGGKASQHPCARHRVARRVDIVIAGDIQLADRCLKNGAQVLGHGGYLFTVNSFGAARRCAS